MFKDIIIMTKSDKHGGCCVAGIDASNNNFVRLMSENKGTFGALNEDDMLYEDNSKAKILDIARIKILKDSPTPIQPENITIDTTCRWQKSGSITEKELEKYLNEDIFKCK